MNKIFVGDTETATITGPVCDFAALQIDEELNVIATHESLIDPGVRITPATQAVHNISNEMVADAPTMAEYLGLYGNPFKVTADDKLYFIAHNAQFDCRMLGELLPEKYTRVCTLRMVRNLWPDIEDHGGNHKLATLAIMFGLETGPAHRAMGDTVTCLNLIRYIADVTKVSSFDELMKLGTRTLSLDTKIGFGKHKGMRLKELPMSYVEWICKQQDMDADLREALATRLK